MLIYLLLNVLTVDLSQALFHDHEIEELEKELITVELDIPVPYDERSLTKYANEFWFPECRNCICCEGFKHGCKCCVNGVIACTDAFCDPTNFYDDGQNQSEIYEVKIYFRVLV